MSGKSRNHPRLERGLAPLDEIFSDFAAQGVGVCSSEQKSGVTA
jgi:hypothetical protein